MVDAAEWQAPQTGSPAIRSQIGLVVIENLRNGGLQRSLQIVGETLANLLPLFIVQNGYEQHYSFSAPKYFQNFFN
ncbi:hypothetical protein ABIC84_005467 [Mucilaginibacter sp. 3215]